MNRIGQNGMKNYVNKVNKIEHNGTKISHQQSEHN
jgi:hypothetical protein